MTNLTVSSAMNTDKNKGNYCVSNSSQLTTTMYLRDVKNNDDTLCFQKQQRTTELLKITMCLKDAKNNSALMLLKATMTYLYS